MGRPSKAIKYFIDANGCWNCISHRTGGGYPKVSVDGKLESLHRAVYKEVYNELPENRKSVVMHKCDNKLCFNPDHLEIGRQSKNVSDGRSRSHEINTERIEILIQCGVKDEDIMESQGLSLKQYLDIRSKYKPHDVEIHTYREGKGSSKSIRVGGRISQKSKERFLRAVGMFKKRFTKSVTVKLGLSDEIISVEFSRNEIISMLIESFTNQILNNT